MKYSIFYDLETTSKYPIGQILNYCFTLLGPDYSTIAELTGLIRISPLELPSPGAIVANQTDVLEHQALAVDSEFIAAQKIAQFISAACNRSEKPVEFIGYNSSKFDLMYLRTTLIRNGINPYFEQKLAYRDMLHGIRKLSAQNPDFPRLPAQRHKNPAEPPRLSLSLETLALAFGLTHESQKHESSADVHLSIDLAKLIHQRFDCDLRSYAAFEPHPYLGKSIKIGSVVAKQTPNYLLPNAEPGPAIPYLLLDVSPRYSLWVDLNAFAASPDQSSIRWMNHATAGFVLHPEQAVATESQLLGGTALSTLKHINLRNYFTTSTCDIEQDIYRLDFRAIEALTNAIFSQGQSSYESLKALKNRDLEVIFTRFRMREWARLGAAASELEHKAMAVMLGRYAQHRYGGKLKMAKFERESDTEEFPEFHQTAFELEQERLQLLEENQDKHSPVAVQVLTSLGQYYQSSPAWQASYDLSKPQPITAAG